MNKEDLNKKIWYRAIKTVFILAFFGAEIIGLFFAYSLAMETPRGYTYAELQQLGAKPIKMTQAEYRFIYGVAPVLSFKPKIKAIIPKKVEKESLLTKAVLLGIKPSDTERESAGKLPISDSNFQILKSNVQKMADVKIISQDINSYVKTAFSKFDQGGQIQILKPYKKKLYKYSVVQKIGIYSGVPLLILIFFVLLSRIFYYVFFGEKFFSLKI